MLALKHQGKETSTSYIQFRQLLDILEKQGVDMKLLKAAYFENDTPDMPSEQRKSSWKAFSKNIHDIYPGAEGERGLSDTLRGIQTLLAVDNTTGTSAMALLSKKL